MSTPAEKFQYQVGGSLEKQAPCYVTRQADEDFYQALKVGEFCYVLNSRQMGKSSLRVRVMQRLQAESLVLRLRWSAWHKPLVADLSTSTAFSAV